MRYNPTECWAGLRDYGKDDTHAIDIAKDYVVKCVCPPGYMHGAEPGGLQAAREAACMPRTCPQDLPQQVELQDRVSKPACGERRGLGDSCILHCAPGFGHSSVVFTCNNAGQWVSDQVLECSAVRVLKVEPVVVGERFLMPVPRFVTHVGFDFEHSVFESKACVQHAA